MLCFMFERAQGTFALTAGAAGGAPKIAALVLLSVLAGCSSPRQTSKGSAGGAGGQAGGSGKDAGIDLSGTGGNTNPDAKLDADSRTGRDAGDYGVGGGRSGDVAIFAS